MRVKNWGMLYPSSQNFGGTVSSVPRDLRSCIRKCRASLTVTVNIAVDLNIINLRLLVLQIA